MRKDYSLFLTNLTIHFLELWLSTYGNGVQGVMGLMAHMCVLCVLKTEQAQALVLPQVATPGEISLKSLAWKWGLMVRSIVDGWYHTYDHLLFYIHIVPKKLVRMMVDKNNLERMITMNFRPIKCRCQKNPKRGIIT